VILVIATACLPLNSLTAWAGAGEQLSERARQAMIKI
jgi:hypothetical protein